MREVTCLWCEGKFIATKSGAHKYCSKECWRNAYNARMRQETQDKPKDKIACRHCRKEFVPKAYQSFCSEGCRTEWKNVKRRQEQTVKECQRCGKSFMPVRRSQLHCSEQCRWGNASRDGYTAICPICKEAFKTDDWRRRYCQACDEAKLYSKGPRRVSPETRARVLREQNNVCWLCKEILSFDKVHTHHLDGSGANVEQNNSDNNLVAMHGHCHKLFHQIFLVRDVIGRWSVQGEIFNMLKIENISIKGG